MKLYRDNIMGDDGVNGGIKIYNRKISRKEWGRLVEFLDSLGSKGDEKKHEMKALTETTVDVTSFLPFMKSGEWYALHTTYNSKSDELEVILRPIDEKTSESSSLVCYPIPLTKDEIRSDYDYPDKFVTVRWTRECGSGELKHQIVVDWKKCKMWVDGELYFDGKRLRKESKEAER